MITENILRRSGFSSLRAFHPWSWIYRSPSGSLANYVFVFVSLIVNPAVTNAFLHWCCVVMRKLIRVTNRAGLLCDPFEHGLFRLNNFSFQICVAPTKSSIIQICLTLRGCQIELRHKVWRQERCQEGTDQCCEHLAAFSPDCHTPLAIQIM